MDKTLVIMDKEIKLNKPVLIEGLPGLGLVGKIAAEYMIKKLGCKKFASLYSPDFPPQVAIMEDGTIKNMTTDFYYCKAENEKQHDLIIVVGDHQGITPRSHYEIVGKILDIAEMYGTKMIFTLGGYGVGRIVREPRVLGAATSKKIVTEMKKYGIEFRNVSGAIVGAAGLLLGVGKIRKMDGICLMCETHGQLADPLAAKKIIETLNKILNTKIDTKQLDEQAKEAEEGIKKLQRMAGKQRILQPEVIPEQEQAPNYFR